MGDLTAAQIAAIPAGRIGQKLEVLAPRVYGNWTIYTANVAHDDTASPPVRGVTSWGSRGNSVTNVSPKSPGEVMHGRCEFTIDNSDGIANINTVRADGIFYSTTILSVPFMAEPAACRVRHSFYVYAAGAWSELPGSPWIGQMQEPRYDDASGEATLVAEGLAAILLREPWHVDHGYDTAVDTSYVSSGFGISSVTSGLTYGGATAWVQATSSDPCNTPVATFTYFDGTANTPTPYGSSSTLHRIEDTSPPSGHWIMCVISLYLTRTVDGHKVIFSEPEVPRVSYSQAPIARPW